VKASLEHDLGENRVAQARFLCAREPVDGHADPDGRRERADALE
jgi:hypothetical protein